LHIILLKIKYILLSPASQSELGRGNKDVSGLNQACPLEYDLMDFCQPFGAATQPSLNLFYQKFLINGRQLCLWI